MSLNYQSPISFCEYHNLNEETVKTIVTDALLNSDDGELFLEYTQKELFSFDDGKLHNSTYTISSGFGLRSTIGDSTSYAYANKVNLNSLTQAAKIVHSNSNLHTNIDNTITLKQNSILYPQLNPIETKDFNSKIKLLQYIDSYLRQNPYVKQVSISLLGEWQNIEIIKLGGFKVLDIRPLVRLNISVIVEKNGKMERGFYGAGGRVEYHDLFVKEQWQYYANEALRQALVNLEAVPSPAGEMQIILGAGWPGILLHEAIGHGLEGDFNRKKVSSFSELQGKQIAAQNVTVVDDGTILNRRGSLNIDDEGTPTQKTTLISNGILESYMLDRMNARLMNKTSTGNGRRASFVHQPFPRMTNTYMLPGNVSKENIISSVKKGLYAVNFSGGQVDITSGKFVFSASEAYLVENGKITTPVKGATLIGNGPDVLTKIIAVGNDLQLDPGIGTCVKNGQMVPVGVGQPTLLLDKLTVGGTYKT
ncbi:protease TldD [Rickettsiales bacterium Ac37b]|nr:protease TldD [Rickettsiales bacterium Ac37b]